MPKLLVFSMAQVIRAKVDQAIRGMSREELDGVLDFITNGKDLSSKN